MTVCRFARFVAYDGERDLFVHEFEAPDDASARAEFGHFYRQKVRGDRWETRTFGRYFLYHVGFLTDGVPSSLEAPRLVMLDDEVRLDHRRFLFADPPHDEAAFQAAEAEFDRLDSLDAERLARKANFLAELVASQNARAAALNEAAGEVVSAGV